MVGRPSRQSAASTIIVTFRITADEKEQLRRIAARKKASISSVLRSLIRKEAARLETGRPDGRAPEEED